MQLAITGASGRLGQLVASVIRRRSPTAKLRLLTRKPSLTSKSNDTLTEFTAADFDRPDSLTDAFSGVDVLLLISTNADPERRLRQHLSAIAAAVRCGVTRIVYTSYAGARLDSPFSLARNHAATEMALQASGVNYTILRIGQYAEALDGFIAGSMGADCLIMPAARAPITYVPRGNVASVAAGAMIGRDHECRIYEITGSHAFRGEDIAALIGSVRGRAPAVVDADPWEYLQATAVPFGVPGFMISAMAELWARASEGEYSGITADAERLAAEPLVPLTNYIENVARGMMI